MPLKKIDVVDSNLLEDFKNKYYNTSTPLIIKNIAKKWPVELMKGFVKSILCFL
jgi:hypothetical protein